MISSSLSRVWADQTMGASRGIPSSSIPQLTIGIFIRHEKVSYLYDNNNYLTIGARVSPRFRARAWEHRQNHQIISYSELTSPLQSQSKIKISLSRALSRRQPPELPLPPSPRRPSTRLGPSPHPSPRPSPT